MTLSVSLEQKLSLPLLSVGTVMLVVTLAEPYWFQDSLPGDKVVHLGLWKTCEGHGNDDCVSLDGSPSWITGPEALECVSVSCAVGALALSFRMLFRKTRLVCFLSAFHAFVSGLLGLVGAVVFHNKVEDSEAAWCFYVNVVADVLEMVSGIILAVHFFLLMRRG